MSLIVTFILNYNYLSISNYDKKVRKIHSKYTCYPIQKVWPKSCRASVYRSGNFVWITRWLEKEREFDPDFSKNWWILSVAVTCCFGNMNCQKPSITGLGRLALKYLKNRGETVCLVEFGGAKEGRTPDLLHAMQARYQLRHSPILKNRKVELEKLS